MLHRVLWLSLSLVLTIGLLSACTAESPPAVDTGSGAPTPGGPDQGTTTAKAVAPSVPDLASPQPAAVTASPEARDGEPAGQVVYVWHTAITPAWLDPQENPQVLTPYGFQYALHDAVAKHLPGEPLAPSLAESYEIADDFMSAIFTLREGITFHNGEPVTPEDVIFTFENYRGANADVLHAKTERVEAIDDRTVRFTFREPFLDFQILYASPASGAAWVVPKAYYQEVGPDGFKQNPIGAGPYKLVQHTPGSELVFEAFTDYWRKTPAVKTLIIRSIPEDATRVSALQNGEVDAINLVTGPLLDVIRADPQLQLAPVLGASRWLEFPGFEQPDNPYHDPRVREAVSLALDRRAMSEAEEGGLSGYEGNWIPENWPGAISRPMPEQNVERARQLLAEAGYPDGFDGGELTPLPPYFSLGERVLSQLRDVGIELRLNQMERGAFLSQLTEGPGAFGTGIILQFSAAPGDAAARIRSYAICEGSSSRTCVPEIEERFQRYEASTDPQERERLLTEIQEYILDNHVFVPLHRLAFINAQGPRIANPWEDVWTAIPQHGYLGPFEDIQLRQ